VLGRQADWQDPNWRMLDQGPYGCGARYLLGIAINHDNLELAEWLLQHGASPNAPPAPGTQRWRPPQTTLYEEAVRAGNPAMADLLLRFGAAASTPHLQGEEALVAACLRLDRENVKALLHEHPEYLASTAVMFAAARKDRADAVALLLDPGMSPDVKDAKGQSALHVAAYHDAAHVAALLIERGAAIDSVDAMHDGTPLWWAPWDQRRHTMELLSRYSRDVWCVSFMGKVERLRELLNDDPGLAKLRGSETTPLMWLPDDEARALEIAKLFLAHGANPSLRNKDGQTAADLARKRGMDRVADLLTGDGGDERGAPS
jgi:uncharacterized protein